jgi:lipopolysaccharide heptosyltransferase I
LGAISAAGNVFGRQTEREYGMTRPRILIVRLSAIGDVIHGLPVLNALRRRFPEAFLGWVIEGRAADVVEGHEALDQLIRVPRGWTKSLGGVRRVRRELKRFKFDIAVDLQCLTKSSLAAWLSGAPRRLGAAGADGREISKWFNNELTRVAQAEHVIDHYLQIVRPLGIHASAVRFGIPRRSEDVEYVADWLNQAVLRPGEFALLNPGAGWPSKIWPAENYAQLARRLGESRGVPSLVVWGNRAEGELAKKIAADCPRYATLAPPTSMTQLAEFARSARLFVGSDTGPMHLSVAVGTPTISLHGTSRAEWTGAYGPHNQRLQAWYQGGSARRRRSAANDAMRAISVDHVAEACETLLQRDAARRSA